MSNLPANTTGGANSPPQEILRSRGLRKAYRMGSSSLEVLKGIELSVTRGERLAIVGASGAGKSTLLHVLGGLDRPTGGSVWLDGVSIYDQPMREVNRLRNRKVGFIFQAYQLLPELDALENVSLPGWVSRQPGHRIRRRAEELLASVGLGDRLRHRPAELSGGEQQRVAIARALVNEPETLFADEPTGNLDSATGGAVIGLLLRLQRECGMTLILVTHELDIARHCQRVLEMRDGILSGSLKAP